MFAPSRPPCARHGITVSTAPALLHGAAELQQRTAPTASRPVAEQQARRRVRRRPGAASGTAGRRAKGRGAHAGEEPDGEDGEEEELDIFNLDAGLFADDAGPVKDYGWGVEDLEDSDDEEEWGVSSEPVPEADLVPKAGLSRQDERSDRWGESPALRSLPRHVLASLHEYQEEADRLSAALDRNRRRAAANESKVHRRLRVISGSLAGRRLLSGRGETTRPMMEKVRAAVFDMLHARCGLGGARLPEGSRWLDLFAGTGSVGLEALSRGAAEAQFIELDPWVVRSVLLPNLQACGALPATLVHTMRAEDFLRSVRDAPDPAYHPPFDFISVCPPYLKVAYPELFALLEGSPLVGAHTHVVVEYPRRLREQLPPALGPLPLVRDRKFGRTWLAVYGPT